MQISTFDQWVNTLSVALSKADAIGMSDEAITKSATELGNFLASKIEPDIPENKLLKALWETGTDDEKQALASMVVKVVKNEKYH